MDISSADAIGQTETGDFRSLEHSAHPADRSSRQRLIDLYENEFMVIPADRPERRRAAHGLRYQVYCVENAFEDAATHPDCMEADEFDSHSVHHLLQRREDGAAIGTVRLILPLKNRLQDCLPFSRLCRTVVPRLDLLLPLGEMAEVSRFCISKELRRRTDGRAKPLSAAALSRYATLGLIRGLVAASLDRGIGHWCLVVEPALLRFLASLGLHFEPLGPLVDYHGLRQPCHANLATLIDGVRSQRPEVWEVITDDGRLAQSLRRKGDRPADSRRLHFLPPTGRPGRGAAALAMA